MEKGFNPEKIILFGSYAKGTFHKDSDINLCIVAETDNKTETLSDMYSDIKSDRPFDIILYTPEESARCIRVSYSFAFQINRDGMILYSDKY